MLFFVLGLLLMILFLICFMFCYYWWVKGKFFCKDIVRVCKDVECCFFNKVIFFFDVLVEYGCWYVELNDIVCDIEVEIEIKLW